MRLYPILSLPFALFLTSCANQGVIVRKDSGPLPFYESLGIDGSYKLALRDSAGAVHSQLVTPEVFEGYAEGQYFNDQQPAAAQGVISAAAKGTAAVKSSATGSGQFASGGSAKGNHLGGNRIASAHAPAVVKPRPSIAHSIASAQQSSALASAPPQAERPVVSAHFTLPVQGPASAAPVATTSADSPAVQSVAGTIVAPRPSLRNQAVAQRIARSSSHVASTVRRLPSAATVAYSAKTLSSAAAPSTSQPVASTAKLSSAPSHKASAPLVKSAKRPAQSPTKKTVDPSRAARQANGGVGLVPTAR